MVTEEPKDPFKGVDWKAIGGELQKDPSAGTKPIIKKRLPKKIRQIPDYYFLPRLPLTYRHCLLWSVYCRWSWCWHATGDVDK
ncbi:hypothetical protein NC652_000941 [Populus alba x Populus x berolinensis]|nr:hypothetical protein NC652_000941 [Populus alba x Populus x berolinensis]